MDETTVDTQHKDNTTNRHRTTANRRPSASGYGKYFPSLVLGVLTTLLAMGFNYLVYDSRIPARAAGNRILKAAHTDGGVLVDSGNGDGLVPSPWRMLASAINISDDIVQDAMFALRGSNRDDSTKDRIAVIAIDEDSLVRNSSWPWPRSDIAKLMEKAEDAKVIGLDILFADTDKTSLSNYVERFAGLYGVSANAVDVAPESLDNDRILAGQVSRTPTVLGAVLFDGTPPQRRLGHTRNNIPPRVVLPDGTRLGEDTVLLKSAKYALTNIELLRGVTPPPVGEGFMNLFPSPSGVVRSIPVLAHVSGEAFSRHDAGARHIVPSVALEVMRVHLGGDSYRVNLRGDRVRIPEFSGGGDNGDRYAVAGISIVADERPIMTIPLSELAEMEITFRNHQDDFTVYPAWEVLAGMHDGAFKDKIVLIGGTVAGVGYVVSTGLADSEVSIVRAHAAMVSAMLKGDFLDSSYQHDYFWQQVCILAVGALVTLAMVFGDVLTGVVSAAACIACVFIGNYLLFFRQGFGVGVTVPALSTVAVLAVLLASNYLSVGRERRFIRKAFALNVSPSILSYLESHPDRLSSLQGEHRHMTVLFSDIRGFTSMSERMTAPDLARFLNEYFTPMSDIVMRNMGTVDKFIGDGLMAFWNAPTDNPDHARDAARAALDMVAELDRLQPEWTSQGLPQISIGCGINTGLMFAGNMGSEQRKNYTVMGDNVNIASRLEGLNKVYSSSILITESTREQLGRDFIYRVVDKVRVSGKESPVVIYELLGTGPASEEQMEELAAFARVFELYQQKEFAAAESLLKVLLFIRPTPLYKLYRDRLSIYMALPPPADWDGTYAKLMK